MRVIYVDDEQIALDEMRDVLGALPEVTGAEFFLSPPDALAWLRENPADAAFLDIRMRRMDGLSLAKEVKDIQPRCAIVFVTGYDQYAVAAFRLHPSGYLMKPYSAADIRAELEYIKNTLPPPKPLHRARAQTFGNFEFFIDGEPVHFKRAKTKELLAYLVDRRGAAVTTAEICATLWEEQSNSDPGYLRHLISDLKKTLSAVGASDIFRSGRNSYAVDVKRLDCDAYRFRQRDISAINAYSGEYMTQYSWAELTLGELEEATQK